MTFFGAALCSSPKKNFPPAQPDLSAILWRGGVMWRSWQGEASGSGGGPRQMSTRSSPWSGGGQSQGPVASKKKAAGTADGPRQSSLSSSSSSAWIPSVSWPGTQAVAATPSTQTPESTPTLFSTASSRGAVQVDWRQSVTEGKRLAESYLRRGVTVPWHRARCKGLSRPPTPTLGGEHHDQP